MKKFLFLLIPFLSACSCAFKSDLPIEEPKHQKEYVQAMQIEGVDTLGSPQYPKELRSIPNQYCISGFAKTFGDFFPVAKGELQAGRKCIRVNLLWSDTHQYGASDLPFVKSESKRYDQLCAQFSDRKIELAPFTEHNLKTPDQFLSVVKANAPNCSFAVNTVWNGNLTKNPQFKNEVHGNHQKPNIPGLKYNYSFDGTNSVDANITDYFQRYKDAEVFFVWNPRLNGKWSMKDSTPRPQRKAWPSVEFLQSLVYLYSGKGVTELPKGWTVKSHSEKHGPEDAKGDKLLIISPVRQYGSDNEVRPIVLKRNGQKVCQLTYYGPFDGGGYRYYASVMGYKCGPNLEVWIGSKKYGTINGGFRDGNYRN